MYQCKTPGTAGTCSEWVEVSAFGLPALTQEQLGELLSAVALVLVMAWGFKLVARFLLNR